MSGWIGFVTYFRTIIIIFSRSNTCTGISSSLSWSLMTEDPIVVRVGTSPSQDTVIPSAVLDRVDINVVSLNAISVTA